MKKEQFDADIVWDVLQTYAYQKASPDIPLALIRRKQQWRNTHSKDKRCQYREVQK